MKDGVSRRSHDHTSQLQDIKALQQQLQQILYIYNSFERYTKIFLSPITSTLYVANNIATFIWLFLVFFCSVTSIWSLQVLTGELFFPLMQVTLYGSCLNLKLVCVMTQNCNKTSQCCCKGEVLFIKTKVETATFKVINTLLTHGN